VASRYGKYSRRIADGNYEFLASATARAELSARVRSSLVVRSFANDEVRISWRYTSGSYKRGADGRFVSDAQGAENAALVHNGKPQLLTSAFENPSPRIKSRLLSRYGAHTLREGCAVLEQRYGMEVAFVTLTLPGSTRESMDTFARHSSDIWNAFMQRLRTFRHAEVENPNRRESREWGRSQYRNIAGLEFGDRKLDVVDIDYCGVWEYQTRGALHLHIAIGLPDPFFYEWLHDNHQRLWVQVLETYSKKTGVDLFASADGYTWRDTPNVTRTECAKVYKSVGRYISKYVSKDASRKVEVEYEPPHRWWFCSASLKAALLAQRLRVERFYSPLQDMHLIVGQLEDFALHLAKNDFVSRNPFSDEVCGRVMFFEKGQKDFVFEVLKDMVENVCVCREPGLWDVPDIPERPKVWRLQPPDEHGELVWGWGAADRAC